MIQLDRNGLRRIEVHRVLHPLLDVLLLQRLRSLRLLPRLRLYQQHLPTPRWFNHRRQRRDMRSRKWKYEILHRRTRTLRRWDLCSVYAGRLRL